MAVVEDPDVLVLVRRLEGDGPPGGAALRGRVQELETNMAGPQFTGLVDQDGDGVDGAAAGVRGVAQFEVPAAPAAAPGVLIRPIAQMGFDREVGGVPAPAGDGLGLGGVHRNSIEGGGERERGRRKDNS
nr:hypothetical protein [Streptomyces antimycoticus]